MLKRVDLIKKQEDTVFDVLVIGGGATGAGVALDAATRGYSVALAEAEDFGGQTSSRSTKLLHGGVRYLESAFTQLDFSQFKLVQEGLEERAVLFEMAPYLTRLVPIYIPIYRYIDALYYWAGIKVYTLLAGSHSIKPSRWALSNELMALFPKLRKRGLKGGILYYDGQFNDARMNLAIILTAMEKGAAALNYAKVISLEAVNGRLSSAVISDKFTERTWKVNAKVIVNATGPFGDVMRLMDNPSAVPLLQGSAGTHLVVDASYTPQGAGLLIPKTADKRVIFMLPWEGSTLVGTTDCATEVGFDPQPRDEEVSYLRRHTEKYLGMLIEAHDIRSVWTGIRPLLNERDKGKTSRITRDFCIERSASRLYSLLGGKWTSFRKMAEALLDQIIENGDLSQRGLCVTKSVKLIGTDRKGVGNEGDLSWLPNDIADHLISSYGVKSKDVADLAKKEGLVTRLAEAYPYIEAEVIWAVRQEYALTVSDVLERRTSLKTLNKSAAQEAAERVKFLIAKEI